jgi:predicted nuclease with TOPRIM domain
MPRNEASCLIEKTSIYLVEYLGKDFLKELNMAFVSIGQKYGFVSIGDYFRQQLAEERLQLAEERQQMEEERQQLMEERQQFEEKLAEERDKLNKAEEEKLRTARELYKDKIPIEVLVKRFNLTKEQILGK